MSEILKKLSRIEYGGTLIVVVIIITFWIRNEKDNGITSRKKTAIGLITDIKLTNQRNVGSEAAFYSFYVNGIKYKGRDGLNTVAPKRVRLGEPKIGGYYVIEYDSLNIDENRIVIGKKPLDHQKLINRGVHIDGHIKRSLNGYDPYIDLFIEYSYQNENFAFRTRLHKDSLECGTLEDCLLKKTIPLKVSKKYPFFNDLYFASRDRQYKK